MQALVRPSLGACYVPPHFLTVTAWHGGMALWCVCVCGAFDGTDGPDGQNRLTKRDSGRERKRGRGPTISPCSLSPALCGNDLKCGEEQGIEAFLRCSVFFFCEFTRGDRQRSTPGSSPATCGCSPACWLHAWWVPGGLRYTTIFPKWHIDLSSYFQIWAPGSGKVLKLEFYTYELYRARKVKGKFNRCVFKPF